MSSTEMSLVFEDIARGILPREESSRARRGTIRVVLLPGEVLRIPRRARRLEVAAGAVWITCVGRDLVLERGQGTRLARHVDCAVASALGTRLAVLELRG